MASRRSRKSKPRRPRRVRRSRRASSSRPRRTRSSRRGKKGRVSVRALSRYFPDVAISKLKTTAIYLTKSCNDPLSLVYFNPLVAPPGRTNCIVLALNSNPAGGAVLEAPPGLSFATYFPVQTFTSKYSSYRCRSVTIDVVVVYADLGDLEKDQVAKPYQISGFPFQNYSNRYGNFWAGDQAIAPFYTGLDIPAMKYGFKYVSGGLGGKSTVHFRKTYDIPKIFGHNESQWLSHEEYKCFPQQNILSPDFSAYLLIDPIDFNTTLARSVSFTITMTQRGRWEGQLADLF